MPSKPLTPLERIQWVVHDGRIAAPHPHPQPVLRWCGPFDQKSILRARSIVWASATIHSAAVSRSVAN
jgi:hypothetical protein